jgi:hypothetical protein
MRRSTPGSASRASIWARITWVRSADPTRRRCSAVTAGDTEPATSTSRSHRSWATRAIRTPARLISSILSPTPWSPSHSRLAPNVLVWMMSAPALR